MKKSIGIIGGGISGLTLAYHLQKAGLNPVVYEKSDQPGGVMNSQKNDGWLVETGPNTVMARSPKIQQLIDDLGLEDEQLPATDEADKRFIVRDGQPKALPMGLTDFLKTNLFSTSAKLRLMKEPFISAWDNHVEENLAHFVERRLGREFLDYAINPFVAGVYAGDPCRLSVKHAFTKLYELEQKYGSLIWGQIRGARERKKREDTPKAESKLFSFKKGLSTLPHALAHELADHIKWQCQVTEVRKTESKFSIQYDRIDDQSSETASHDAVVYSAPAHIISDIHFEISSQQQINDLNELYYPPVSVIALGFRRNAVVHALDGFGMLIPEVENYHMLGTLFSSSLFPHRAPEDHVLLTNFIGGARQPELAGLPSEKLFETVYNDLKELIGLREAPVYRKHFYWPKAIPQYEVGYGRFKNNMDSIEQDTPGFFFSGNYRAGISVSDCILFADSLSQKIIKFFKTVV